MYVENGASCDQNIIKYKINYETDKKKIRQRSSISLIKLQSQLCFLLPSDWT